MKPFSFYNPKTLDEAVTLQKNNTNSAFLAGGTDLLHIMKQNAFPNQPTTLINLKKIDGLSYIKEESGTLKIGATTKLAEVLVNATVTTNYRALSMAISQAGDPLLHNMATIAGNVLQDVWCWFYRAADNGFNCIRKGGAICYAQAGDNRYYHSIYGGPKGCYAVHPSDSAIALVALNASVITTTRTIPIEQLFQELAPGHTLTSGEIVKEIQIPTPASGSKSAFMKVGIRDSIDFALASAGVWYNTSGGSVSDARIVLGGVYQTPRRSTAAEAYLKGKTIDPSTATTAGTTAVQDAVPMSQNSFKKQLAATMVKRALLA